MLLVLDTNVVSELMRPQPQPQVLAWVGAHPITDMAITAVTIMEIRSGIAYLPEGARKGSLEARFRQFLARGFAGRVLPFDEGAAETCATLRAQRRRLGKASATEDAMIAGIALQRGATVVTRDSGFDSYGVPVIHPWGAP
jgi:predicted nucleic acid-binding protein